MVKPGLKLNLDEGGSTSAQTLPERIAGFRDDPDKMAVATKFVDELCSKAEIEANKRAQAKQDSAKSGNQGRRMSEIKSVQKVATRARGVVVRWFENICNCTHTAIGRRNFFKTRNNSAPAAQTQAQN